MKRSIGFIVVAIGILMYATLLLVALPSLQLDSVQAPSEYEPLTREEERGRRLYVENGCIYCHSQQPRDANKGPDALRNWGRYSVPADYIGDNPHLLGTMRTGPDLHNIGARQPSEDWHLVHLYQPRSVLPNSVMPPYPFLFAEAKEPLPHQRVVPVPPAFKPEGTEIVATADALALVAYLKSLDHTYPIPEDSSDVAALDTER